MNKEPDEFPGISGRCLCAITGMQPQKRSYWADKGMLERRRRYRQHDLIEQVVLSRLLLFLPKGDVSVAWRQIRPKLNREIPSDLYFAIWDPAKKSGAVAHRAKEIVELVRHGRSVHVVPLAEEIREARDAYLHEAAIWEEKRTRTSRPRQSERGRRARE